MSLLYISRNAYTDRVSSVIPADYSGQLMLLLRYPAPPTNPDPSISHHATLLLRQALALSMAPNPSTGSSLAIENRNFLQIPLEVPDPQVSPARSRPPNRRRASTEATKSEGAAGAGVSASGKYVTASGASRHVQQSSQIGLPEMFARGLLEKGESLGINKTVMNAVSEFRVSLTAYRCD